MATVFSAFLIGSESLLISCADTLLQRGHDLRGVISDDAAIRRWCADRGVRVISPKPEYVTALSEAPFDYLLSITNLTVIPAAALALPRRATVNFHDGPLPRYGGLYAPAWALMAGEREHAISWHLATEAVDEGAVLLQRAFPIEDDDTSLTLNTKCFQAGIESFGDLVTLLERAEFPTASAPLDRSSYHGLSERPRGLAALDFQRPAEELARLVRALDFGGYANPLTFARIVAPGGSILAGRVSALEDGDATPGTIVAADGETLRIAAQGGTLALTELRSVDGARLTAADALRSLGVSLGEVLPALDQAWVASVDALNAARGRHDGFWRRRLARLDAAQLPQAQPRPSATGTRRSIPLPTVADRRQGLASVGLFLARATGRVELDVALHLPSLAGVVAFGSSPYTDVVPWRIALEPHATVADARAAVTTALDALTARGGFARDLTARTPELAALVGQPLRLPLGVSMPAHAAEAEDVGTHATVVLAADGAMALHYDAETLQPTDAERLARGLTAMLAATGTLPWTEVPLLAADELTQVLHAWATAEREHKTPACVHELIEAQVRRSPDAVALVCEDRTLTYRELDVRANQLARHLRARGAGPDTLVALCCERSLEMMVGLVGILKSGAAYVPIDPSYPGDRIALMLEDSQAQVIVTTESVLAELPESRAAVVCLDRDAAALAREDEAPLGPTSAPEHLAYCIYTSGSTGRPKGVMVEHRNVSTFFAAMDERLGTTPGVWLAVTSLSFDISVLELCWTLTRGYKVVIYVDENRRAARTAGLDHAHKGVSFSLFYFSADESGDASDRYRVLMEGAKFGDRHGFAAVWTPERHFHAFGGLYPNPAVTGAAVAAVTTRIGVRAGSCVLPLHHPVRVAEEWAVVDNLSGGRVGVSFAAGWQPNDFIFQPQNYQDAKTKTVEMIDTVRRLWRGETLSFPGPRGEVAVRTLPRPVQQDLPVWYTTAGNPESYELAGTLGVNVLTHLLGQTVDELADKITLYRKAWKRAGHAGEGQVSLMLHTFVGDSDADVKAIVRGPMKAYLGTSISLIKGFASAFPTFKKDKDGNSPDLDFKSLSAEEMDALLEYSFERYYETSGLFGTVETCAAIVDRLKGIGVDDIACLIDFGIETDLVLRHLRHLNRLRNATSRPVAEVSDQSMPSLVTRHRVTHLQCTPSMAGMFVADARSRDALRQLQVMCVGGEAFPPALADELQRIVPGDVHNMYGPTETTIWSAMHTLQGSSAQVPLGTPLARNQLLVLDALRQPVPVGVAGELYIGGDQVVRGYWRRPELTTERFVPNHLHPAPGARLYRTGDLVRWTPAGQLEFLGRVDFQVKVRGYRIELGEIEATLGRHANVRECAVIARTAPGGGDPRLVAYVVLRAPDADTDAQLRAHLRQSLPEFMVPSHFVPLRDLPRTPNGKIDRNALPDPMAELARHAAAAPAEVVAPTGELEDTIAAIWRDVLRLPSVGVTDNFFDLGGHSLLAVQVHSRLKQALQRDIAITELFRFPTIRRLAESLSGAGADTATRLAADRASQRREMAARRTRRPTS